MTREYPYRGIFKTTHGPKTSWLTLDFYAEGRLLARDHALMLARDIDMHKEWGVLEVVKVVKLKAVEVWTPGKWRPVDPPQVPLWASPKGRRR